MKFLIQFLIIQILNLIIYSSPNYLIPSYYGSKHLDFLEKQFVSTGVFSTFYWKQWIDKVDNKYVFADGEKHIILGQEENGKFKRIAGQNGVSGYRDGDLKSTLFNGPYSIIYYKQNKRQAILEEKYKKTIITKNVSLECQFITNQNYTSCIDSYQYQNNGVLDDKQDKIQLEQIQLIYNITDAELQELPGENEYESPVYYISDKNNHCIRKINLEEGLTYTVAGSCGNEGFKDGPKEINRLSYPTSIGIDLMGNIFIYDSGNNYIRMVNKDGQLNTLQKGACQEDTRKNIITYQDTFQYQVKPIICYINWLKEYGVPEEHIFEDNIKNICSDHISQCSS